MSTLKNSLNKYAEAKAFVVDYFKINDDIGEIIDYTNLKWYKESETEVVTKDKYGYTSILFCVGNMYETPLYTLVIGECKSFVLDNKLKSDKTTLFLENGK